MRAPLPPLHACGCLDIAPDGTVQDVNEVFAQWVGSTREAIIGTHFSDVVELRLPPSGTTMVPGDAAVLTRAGIRLPVVLGAVETSADGSIQVAAFDVSPESGFARPFAEATSDRGKRRLQILFNASFGFAEARSDGDAARVLADVARRAFAATAVSVHILQGDDLAFVAGENPLAPYWPAGYVATGLRTFEAGEVLIVPTPDDAERFVPGMGIPDVYRAAGIQSALAAPIRSKGVALGSFICYFDHPRTFDEEAVPLAEALANQTAQAIQRARLEETLRRMAMLDDLTGLPSRRLLEEQVAAVRAEASSVLAVMFIDLDGFKRVNDTLGHATGDVLLTQVAERLRGVTREGELIGRFGGDEFIAVAHVPAVEDATAVADRIRSAFDRPFAGIPEDLRITASIGVAVTASADDIVLDRLVRAADQTMYQAKLAGGNAVAITSVHGPDSHPFAPADH